MKASLAELYTGDVDALSRAYPDGGGTRPYDASSADMSLAQHLCFWTGCDGGRIQRIMRTSALARDKWDTNRSYLRRTIAKAISQQVDVLQDPPSEAERAAQRAEAVAIGEGLDESVMPCLMTVDEMRQRLVFVESRCEVVDRLTSKVRRWEAALGTYDASIHEWVDDRQKTRQTPALLAWRKDTQRISVDVITWAPGRPEFCNPPEAAGADTRAINTWRGGPRHPDVADYLTVAAPFVEHVAYLIPDVAQRKYTMQYFGHLAQHPGELPHTAILMIALTTGIGRGCLASILARVFHGHTALGVSLPEILDGGFNGRLSQRLLAVVEETRDGTGKKKYERSEALKRIVTEEHRHVDMKYGPQRVEYNACRWLMFSNHLDALPFDRNDRRIVVIENPSERRPAEHYARLYALARDPTFIAAVWGYLRSVDVSDFSAGAHAPMSTAKARVLDAMESGADKALAAFREQWPGTVAGLTDIRQFVMEETGAPVNDAALRHSMQRKGWTRPDVRPRLEHGVRERPVFLDGVGVPTDHIAPAIMDARRKFSVR